MHQREMVINLPLLALPQPREVFGRNVCSVILQCFVVAKLSRKLLSTRDEFPRSLEKFFADSADVELNVVGNEVFNPHISASLLEGAMYRNRSRWAAACFESRSEDCVITESDRHLLKIKMSVREELNTFIVGIARLALEVIAYIHDLFTREHCSMRCAHPLLQVYMEADVRPIC